MESWTMSIGDVIECGKELERAEWRERRHIDHIWTGGEVGMIVMVMMVTMMLVMMVMMVMMMSKEEEAI